MDSRTELVVNRHHIATTELRTSPLSPLAPGHVRLRVERFAVTANNITYAKFGDALAYWDFYPLGADWGHVPSMGWAAVEESDAPGVAVGSRYFGWYPMATSVDVAATATADGFRDDGPHRAPHAPAYRAFTRTDADAFAATGEDEEDRHALLRGLFVTGFLIDQFFAADHQRGAEQAVVLSASSKTAIAYAHCAHERGGLRVVGVTAASNEAFVRRLGLYDQVVSYDELDGDALERVPSLVVDMAGAGRAVAAVHRGLGDLVRYSMVVGKSHHDAAPAPVEAGPRPEMFFAPGEIQRRLAEWGPDEYRRRAADALRSFIDGSRRWLTVEHHRGPTAAQAAWTAVHDGQVPPDRGVIVSLHD
jgi:hypothetical protein